MVSFPTPNPPDPGYAENLDSYVFEAIKLAMISRLKNSSYFKHVSAFFPYPSGVTLDDFFPYIEMHIDSGEAEPYGLLGKNKMLTTDLDITYYAKHLKDQGYSAPEISHFIEYCIYLIEDDLVLYLVVGNKEICVRLKGVAEYGTDFHVDGNYLISMGRVTVQMLVPVCVLQPYEDEDEDEE